MADFLNKLFFAGVGALSITVEKIDSIAEHLITKGTTVLQEKKGVASAWLERAAKTPLELQTVLKKELQRVLTALDLPTRQELEELQQRLNALEQEKR